MDIQPKRRVKEKIVEKLPQTKEDIIKDDSFGHFAS